MKSISRLVVRLVSLMMFSCGEYAWGATINVPADQPTIQAGIDAAVSGFDEVLVVDGTYNEIIDLRGKAITVRSVNGASVTTIDATGVPDPGDGKPVIRCDSGEDPSTVIDGFTITGGTGDTVEGGGPVGGGMFNFNNSSPTVLNCVFRGNSANFGAGMANWCCSTTVINCVFSDNTATVDGGGLWNACGPSKNTKVINCVFVGNTANSFGGGLYVAVGSGSSIVTNCTFSGNSASDNGGGIWIGSGTAQMENCILWENSDMGGMNSSAQIHVSGGTAVVNYSNVQGTWAGAGSNNIAADPLFVDADGPDNTVGTVDDDLHLLAGSPCINGGNNSVVTEMTDLDGNNRIAGAGCGFAAIVDMGPYEFDPSPGDQDGDGVANASDNCPCYPNPTQEYNPADFDEDCDVDGVDFSVFASCFNKAGNPPRSLGCPHP